MKPKFLKTYILAAILLIAIGFLVLPKYIKNDIGQTEPQQVFSFETADVNKIDLEYLDQLNRDSGERQVVQLQKVDGTWVVATNHNYQAREKDITSLLEKAGEIKQGELISSNPDRQDELEIGQNSGTHVKLWQDENLLADFWLGKSGAGGGSTYFRAEESDLIYSTKNNIRFYFTKPDWIDKMIWKLAQEEIEKVELDIKWPKVVLEKLEVEGEESEEADDASTSSVSKWEATSPRKFEADESKINSLLSSLSNLNAQEVVFDETLEGVGLDDSKAKVTVYIKDGASPYELIIGDKIEAPEVEEEDELMMGGAQEGYYVKKGDSDQIFVVSGYLIENSLSPKVDELGVEE